MERTVTATKTFEWDMAHRLGDGYTSKCRHLHGHRYRCEVTVEAPVLDRFGMVLDFSVIKAKCAGWVDAHLDHACLVCERDAELIRFLEAGGQRYHVVPFNTTAEQIVNHLARVFIGLLQDDGVNVVHVRLYETPTSYCDWRGV